MLKTIASFVAGIIVTALLAFLMGGDLMFKEYQSPYGMEETAARIQRNIQGLENKGWKLSGLRDPSKAVAASGGNVPPVLLVEACSTEYSGPILKEDATLILSILMPCTITVYKKEDGKVYVGMMNAALMGHMFGPEVGAIMEQVAADQAQFIKFDPDKSAPPLIRTRPGGGGAGGAKDTGGC
jgi:uncharacterized protein (DUF302 family)